MAQRPLASEDNAARGSREGGCADPPPLPPSLSPSLSPKRLVARVGLAQPLPCVGQSRSPRRPPRCVTPPAGPADPAGACPSVPVSLCPRVPALLSLCCVCSAAARPAGPLSPSTGGASSPQALTKGRRSAEAANRCYHCSRVLIDFNYTHIRFLVLLSRCRRLYRTVDNVYPLDLFYWFVCLDLFVWFFFFRDRLEWGEGETFLYSVGK